MWAGLRYREGLRVHTKRGYRLMRAAGWTLKRAPHTAPRTPQAQPTATRPRPYGGIDRTTCLLPALGWASVGIGRDGYPKKIVGWNLALRSRRQEWEAARAQAVQAACPQGGRGAGLRLVSDNGSQPTATRFMATLSRLGIEQVFTSSDNPKGNAETERLMRTIEEERLWLRECTSLEAAREVIAQGIAVDDTQRYVHSALGYRSPQEFEAALRMQEAAQAAA